MERTGEGGRKKGLIPSGQRMPAQLGTMPRGFIAVGGFCQGVTRCASRAHKATSGGWVSLSYILGSGMELR